MSSKSDDLRNDKFSHTAGIAERRVKHSNSMLSCVLDIDLIRSNTEASDNDQVLGLPKYAGGKFRFGTYANNVDVSVIDKPNILRG